MWEVLRKNTMGFGATELLGYLPQIIRAGDGPVVDQVNARYAHGGGWYPLKPKRWILNRADMSLTYPVPEEEGGDEIYKPFARLVVSEAETVYVYDHAWVLIDRGGDDWEVSRMD